MLPTVRGPEGRFALSRKNELISSSIKGLLQSYYECLSSYSICSSYFVYAQRRPTERHYLCVAAEHCGGAFPTQYLVIVNLDRDWTNDIGFMNNCVTQRINSKHMDICPVNCVQRSVIT